jgi:hypothetical protein
MGASYRLFIVINALREFHIIRTPTHIVVSRRLYQCSVRDIFSYIVYFRNKKTVDCK